MQLTIDLPESLVQRLRTLAELTDQPLGDLVLQSIAGNLPPDVESAPSEMQAELLRMQTLSIDELRQIARSQISQTQREQHLELLSKNQHGSLTESEQNKLNELTRLADQLMLKKAHACAILRWRGKPIRSLDQLSPA
ncbi:MAG: hypothetical protein AAF921_09040 [Cyanobacteria bacterium P01_D01_bin.44]